MRRTGRNLCKSWGICVFFLYLVTNLTKPRKRQFTFIRSVLERSPNIEKIVLKGEERCDYCDAFDVPSKFPKKDDQEMVARRIRDGIFSPQIIFDE